MKSALVIIFNQDFSKNIPKLQSIYRNRFSQIVYLVPDHWNKLDSLYKSKKIPHWIPLWIDKGVSNLRKIFRKMNANSLDAQAIEAMGKNFIKVIGHQYYFYDFISQAENTLLELDVDWYWIIGDDALLNPAANEQNMHTRLKMPIDSDSVVCKPVIGTDSWLEKIEESVESAYSRLEKAFGRVDTYRSKLSVRPEKESDNNKEIAVACADFFGLSKETLRAVLPLWKRCLASKLFVEVGLPNALIKASRKPWSTSDFYWQRIGSMKESIRLIEEFSKTPATIFVHPIKLSVFSKEQVSSLCSSEYC